MPYFLYKVFPARQYQLQDAFERYRDARVQARQMRADLRESDTYTVRIVFAAQPAEAERLLSERREARPLGEDG